MRPALPLPDWEPRHRRYRRATARRKRNVNTGRVTAGPTAWLANRTANPGVSRAVDWGTGGRAALHSKYARQRREPVMADRGEVFRRAFSWLPAQFASQSDAPVGAPRRFGSTEHLSTEAIA